MATVTVTIEGDVDEVIATLRGMAGNSARPQYSPARATTTGAWPTSADDSDRQDPAEHGSESATQPAGAVWNRSYVHTFWRNLSETARQAMIRVSRSPNHTQKRAQLMHTLQLSQRELSGSLSSQGHSLNRLKRRRGDVDLPRPLTYDKVNDVYVLDSNFADALQEIGLS